jgi:predicted nucleic acid-binding protein
LPKGNRVTVRPADDHKVFVDSSAWIALFSRRDQHHGDADRRIRAAFASGQQLVTTNLILAEIHRLFLYRAGIKAAAVALEKIEASPLVKIEFAGATHHRSAKGWLQRLNEHTISYTDAVSFAVMEAAGCKNAMSYDRHFQVAGFVRLQAGR